MSNVKPRSRIVRGASAGMDRVKNRKALIVDDDDCTWMSMFTYSERESTDGSVGEERRNKSAGLGERRAGPGRLALARRTLLARQASDFLNYFGKDGRWHN